jgi:hypothetical protein
VRVARQVWIADVPGPLGTGLAAGLSRSSVPEFSTGRARACLLCTQDPQTFTAGFRTWGMAETVTVHLETEEGSDELTVPLALVDLLRDADEGTPQVVGDIAMLGLAQQAHGAVHHAQGGVSEELEAAEALAMDLFEQRFGRSYAEMTGHDH